MILNSPTISGSLTVTGNIITSGSITISGSIASASYASNAELLDGLDSTAFATTGAYSATSASLYATSASLSATSGSLSATSGSLSATSGSLSATSGSLSTASGSFNTRVTALEVTGSALSSSLLTVSGSGYATSASLSTASGSFDSRVATIESKYATTGSNTFTSTQVVSGSILQSGSFTTTGTIIAQTINVQTVTSSVVYSSGSNVFGNSIGNSQTFTGSVLITGSLTIAGASSATSYSGTTIFGSTIACSPIGCFATSCATSFIGGTMSGTTIYGSTAVCSPVGKFTSCLDLGGALTGTSATFNHNDAPTIRVQRNGGTDSNTVIEFTNASCSFYIGSNGTVMGLGGTTGAIGSQPLQIASTGAATFSSSVAVGTIMSVGSNAGAGSLFQYTYSGANANSRTWRTAIDNVAYGDWALQQATTQGGSTFANILIFSNSGAATFSSSVQADGGSNGFLINQNGGAAGLATYSANTDRAQIAFKYAQNYPASNNYTRVLDIVSTGDATGTGIIRLLTSYNGQNPSAALTLLAGGAATFSSSVTATQLDAYTSEGGSKIGATHGTGGTYPKASGISFGATSTSLSVSNNGGTTTFIGGAGIYANNSAASDNPTDLIFWTTSGGSPAERSRITSGGNVGIGTNSPVGKLDISTGGNTNIVISNDSVDTGYNIISLNGTRTKGSYVGIAGGGTGDSNLYLNSAGGVIVQTGASYTQRLTITSAGAATFSSTITGTTIYGSTAVCSAVGYFSGCVGIGTTTTCGLLSINAPVTSVPSIRFQNSITAGLDSAISNYVSAAQTLLVLGTNSYITSVGTICRFNTSYESSYISFDEGTVRIGTGPTSSNSSVKFTVGPTGVTTFSCQIQTNGACVIVNRGDGNPAVLSLGNTQNAYQIQFTCTGGQRIAFVNGTPSEFASFYGTGISVFTGQTCINGSGAGLQFTGGNNRIYFGACRAIEGSTSGTSLQLGEHYTKLSLQAHGQFSCGTEGGSPKLFFGQEGPETAGAKAIYLESYWMILQPHYNEGFRIRAVNASGTQRTLAEFYGSGEVYFPNMAAAAGTYNVKWASGGRITYDNSSCRYKNNIRNSVYGLCDILKLNSRMFEYKDGGRTDVGLIAEEVNQVIPELAIKNPEGQPDAVSYDRMVSVLIKAIQEQQCKIALLESCLGIS